VKYDVLTAVMLAFIGVLYFASSASYLFVLSSLTQVFPAHDLYHSNSFNLYKHEDWLFRNIYYLYLPNNIYTYVMNAIFSTEIIETLPYFRNHIRDPATGDTSRAKIVLLRIAVWLLMVLFSLTTKDVVNILNISGSLFTPIVSYFGPLYIFYSYAHSFGVKTSLARKIHDCFFVAVSLCVSLWGVLNAFN
jgi:hypothetical protein